VIPALIKPYPEGRSQRDSWILNLRRDRNPVDPRRPYGFFVEEEMDSRGYLARTAVILLTNRECPWRCLMCDLWKNTLTDSAPPGAITEQVAFAMDQLGPAEVVKLYNSGSFFDPRAIPVEEYARVAARLHGSRNVIVESHPALVGDRVLRLRDLLDGTLEVALGLETAQPEVLEKLNKGMTLEQFAKACDYLRGIGIAVRAFIIIRPPFTTEDEAAYWAKRSIDFAFDCGAGAVSLIPARAGNGALEALKISGAFQPPQITTVEEVMEYGLSQKRGRVFVDLWAAEAMRACAGCRELRMERLRSMNRQQRVASVIECGDCQYAPETV
jgi:radical SAM enzyme (TIGR01210 family)